MVAAFCFMLLLFFALAGEVAFAQVSPGMLDIRGKWQKEK